MGFWFLFSFGNMPISKSALVSAPAWGPVLEAALMATTLLRSFCSARYVATARIAALAFASLMLLLFGFIHLTLPQAITGLLSEGFPLRSFWPYASGIVQVAAGIAVIWPRARRIALLAIATIYLSWLPLVHGPRLYASPNNWDEWRFALIALALAVALALLTRLTSHNQEAAYAE